MATIKTEVNHDMDNDSEVEIIRHINPRKRAAVKEEEEVPSHKRARMMDDSDGSTSHFVESETVDTKVPSLALVPSALVPPIQPPPARKNLIARRVTTQEVVQQVPAVPVVPPTPPTPSIDLGAIVAAFFLHLQQNPQHGLLLQQSPALAAPAARVKHAVITLDDSDDEDAVPSAQQPAVSPPVERQASLPASTPVPARTHGTLAPPFITNDPQLAALLGTFTAAQMKVFSQLISISATVTGSQSTNVEASPAAAEENENCADGDMHVNFWTGVSKTTECPSCERTVADSKNAKRIHYTQFHYNIYYSQVRQRNEVARWIAQRLGSVSESEKTKNRICLHCERSKIHKGRLGLIRHLRKDHPSQLAEMKQQYTVLAEIDDINDTEFLRRMVSASAH